MTTALTIGRAAREAGVGVETIRFYERQGLIEQPVRPTASGARRYPVEVVERVKFIREAQHLGFTLREVRDLLALKEEPTSDCSEVRERASQKLADVRHKIARLQEIEHALRSLIERCPAQGSLSNCSIMEALSSPAAPCDGACADGQSKMENG